ncbi:hypothetical protein BU16DRAFT_294565 [Lophium mytilinum]|uniref:Uncharacterized protein n=1 Tax=Lophium mytilinum TaxID=390894 RepID=A0A6A6R3T7_9PEZI|nr:hypothetical protein BU16DRAFT_294565 [Lophium mytilinum]
MALAIIRYSINPVAPALPQRLLHLRLVPVPSNIKPRHRRFFVRENHPFNMKNFNILTFITLTWPLALAKAPDEWTYCYHSGEYAYALELVKASLPSVCDHLLTQLGSATFNATRPMRGACRTYPTIRVKGDKDHKPDKDRPWLPVYYQNKGLQWWFQISLVDRTSDVLKKEECVKELKTLLTNCEAHGHGGRRGVKSWSYRADPQTTPCETEWSDPISGHVLKEEEGDEVESEEYERFLNATTKIIQNKEVADEDEEERALEALRTFKPFDVDDDESLK